MHAILEPIRANLAKEISEFLALIVDLAARGDKVSSKRSTRSSHVRFFAYCRKSDLRSAYEPTVANEGFNQLRV